MPSSTGISILFAVALLATPVWAIFSKLINVSAAGQNAIDPVVAVDAFSNAVIARRAFDGVIYRA